MSEDRLIGAPASARTRATGAPRSTKAWCIKVFEVDKDSGALATMSGKRHSWIEVNPQQLAKALSQLRRLPKPGKRVRKAILSLENGELVLSDGLNVVRTKASGLWKVPAVTSYGAFLPPA